MFASVKTREQLLYKYTQIKPNPFFIIFRVPLFVLILIVGRVHDSSAPDIYDEMLSWGFFLGYVLVELSFWVGRQERKLNLIYEIEKNRSQNT